MSALPPDHDFHVDPSSITRASEFLAVLAENFDIDPPKVLPQDGEAVVFTWDYGTLKRYLTIDPEQVDVMDLNKSLKVRCVHEIMSDQDAEAYAKLVGVIGAKPISATTTD
ncbi:hypothetical protein FHT82_006063 [Rhizobium sp. BK275]|uniref:hypothetical protein n=1 Tax=Rhizobium sp. BK275 TaxID=2587077 RepID=UPI00160B1E53|nr:hypothetical protein [Rhizobium sp. BK275]MBB3393269.1 hypothetical protein [Rhizobium sp. BK275]